MISGDIRKGWCTKCIKKVRLKKMHSVNYPHFVYVCLTCYPEIEEW